MCFKPSDKPVTRLKKNSIKYLFSIFEFRYVCQQVNQIKTLPAVLIFVVIKVVRRSALITSFSVLLFLV